MKRQKMTSFRVTASAVMVAGMSSSAIATTIRRFRPITSDSAPVNGAVAATAKVPAVMIRLASAAPTPYSRAIIGSTACGAYRCRNAPMAQKATAMRRGSANMADIQHKSVDRATPLPGLSARAIMRPKGGRLARRSPHLPYQAHAHEHASRHLRGVRPQGAMAPSRRAARLHVRGVGRDEFARAPVGLQGRGRSRNAPRGDGGRSGLADLCEEAVRIRPADGPADLADGPGEVFAAAEEVAVPLCALRVMAGLDPPIHPLRKSWIAGSSPAMTLWYVVRLKFREREHARQ